MSSSSGKSVSSTSSRSSPEALARATSPSTIGMIRSRAASVRSRPSTVDSSTAFSPRSRPWSEAIASIHDRRPSHGSSIAAASSAIATTSPIFVSKSASISASRLAKRR